MDRWRARLREDRPLPGRQPVGLVLRLAGIDDRPRASCSDMIAAAVAEMIGQARPGELEVARYADTCWQAQRGGSQGGAAGVYQPVSFYLEARVSDACEELRAVTVIRVGREHDRAGREALELMPPERVEEAERVRWVRAELRRRGVPLRQAKVPAGVLARMAIDRWSTRPADEVAADAAAYALIAHEHPHRGRRDMRELLG